MRPAYRRLATIAVALAAGVACCAAVSRGPDPVWAQEFTGPAGTPPDIDVWQIMDLAGGWGNQELQAYTTRPVNIAYDGRGNLRITAQRERWTDPRGNRAGYTSARVESVEAFRYGRIEARIRVPAGQGLWSAFWTLGTDRERVGWPAVGEIDIMELRNDTRELELSAHGQAGRRDRWREPATVAAEPFAGEWHVYRLDWTPGRLAWFVDGVQRHVLERADLGRDQHWPFDRPQHLLLNLAVGGRWPGPPDATTPLPAHMLVDWVRVHDVSVIDDVGTGDGW
ncbi:hypothetical protein BJF78_28615 [Pseudonocardia sp. CNS-139]|nr:hypothetical protein BJF78_28615 [Pseudonocardia sp. CNS-139]